MILKICIYVNLNDKGNIMQAITTKYLSATNTRGSRIKATSTSGISVTVPCRGNLDIEENHKAAVVALVKQLALTGHYVAGGTTVAGTCNDGGLTYWVLWMPVTLIVEDNITAGIPR